MATKNIFICYRREDAEGYAGRIYDRLIENFPERVFIDTGIRPGVDFLAEIQNAVASCHVLIAIIGRNWATVTDASHRRRLDLAGDYVRHEIATALSKGITVIPVLVLGAEMPSRELLPPDLEALATINALEITRSDFDHDVDNLTAALKSEFGESWPPLPITPPPITTPQTTIQQRHDDGSRKHEWPVISLKVLLVVGVAAAFLIAIAIFVWNQSDNEGVRMTPTPNQNYNQVVTPLPTPNQNYNQVVTPLPTPNRNDQIVTPLPTPVPPTPTPRSAITPSPTVNEFQPVGHWIITRGAGSSQKKVWLMRDRTYQYENNDDRSTGCWEYFPNKGKLILTNGVTCEENRLVITFESQEGNEFVGTGLEGNHRFTVRLTRN